MLHVNNIPQYYLCVCETMLEMGEFSYIHYLILSVLQSCKENTSVILIPFSQMVMPKVELLKYKFIWLINSKYGLNSGVLKNLNLTF